MSSLANRVTDLAKGSKTGKTQKVVLQRSKAHHPNSFYLNKPPYSFDKNRLEKNTDENVNMDSDFENVAPGGDNMTHKTPEPSEVPTAIQASAVDKSSSLLSRRTCTCAIPALETCDHPVIGCLREGKRSRTLVQDLSYVINNPPISVVASGKPEAAYLAWCHRLELEYLIGVVRKDGAKNWEGFIYNY